VTAPSLRLHLRERLPEYMVPDAIMILEEMPLTQNGKIDRKRLPSLSDVRPSPEKTFIAPRDVLELRLAQIWERLLGVHPVSVTDNFFDLGGHSLLAVSMMTAIRDEVGEQAPLSALFQGGTIERLASILRRGVGSRPSHCLVELQASGSLPPLFFVPPAGGSALCYVDLARSLGTDRPFYGFQTPGLYGERDLYTSIQDLAAHYIEAMRKIEPEGPYFLGGWSIGGNIAYEMAQQLGAQSQEVSQLLLLDSAARVPREEHSEEGEGREEPAEEDDALRMIRFFGEALPISKEDLAQLQGDERIDYIVKKAISVNLLPPDIEVVQVRFFLEVYKANGKALRKYVHRAYPGQVTLFKTATPPPLSPSDESKNGEQGVEAPKDQTMGWDNLAAGGVRVVEVPGSHQTMVNKPHVETLALRIRECLDGIREQPET
jgi:thioesterase domain-containing protein